MFGTVKVNHFRLKPDKHFYDYKFATNGGSKRFMTFFKLDDMKVDENGKYKITVKLPKQTSTIEIYPTIIYMYKSTPVNPLNYENSPIQNDTQIDNATQS